MASLQLKVEGKDTLSHMCRILQICVTTANPLALYVFIRGSLIRSEMIQEGVTSVPHHSTQSVCSLIFRDIVKLKSILAILLCSSLKFKIYLYCSHCRTHEVPLHLKSLSVQRTVSCEWSKSLSELEIGGHETCYYFFGGIFRHWSLRLIVSNTIRFTRKTHWI